MPPLSDVETLTHRLILPRDANHHGTLYAGVLMSLVLEAGYASGYRSMGSAANLVLKRVLDLRCQEPVPIGAVVEIRGREVHRAPAQVVVALVGTPLPGRPDRPKPRPWVEGLLQFVQVGPDGRPEPLGGDEPATGIVDLEPCWATLRDRSLRLLAIRA